ncbi:MAG: glycoside hydrolase family 16 protein [Acidobacteriota bacterium]
MEVIKGTVTGATEHHKIVIYAFAGIWWVQPWADRPYTSIDPEGNWSSKIHLGTEYAALLVQESYKPIAKLDNLPDEGGLILAIARSKGRPVPPPKEAVLQFSGYEWDIRTARSNRGGGLNYFSPENAWVDQRGKLHLRIAKEGDLWTCAEVISKKTFGYGTYRFVVQNMAPMDPGMVLTFFTWNNKKPEVNDREIDIEISRWGKPEQKNSQYVIQPYFLPDNSIRFESPAGMITHSFSWEPDQVFFQSVKGNESKTTSTAPVFQHTFTSAIPPTQGESVCMNFYLYMALPPSSGAGAEIVIEKFIFLP